MKNQLARLLVLVGIVALVVGFAAIGTASAQVATPNDMVLDVDGNPTWVPPPAGEPPTVPDDIHTYLPGYDMDGAARVSVVGAGQAARVTPQVMALIVHVPGVVSGTADFYFLGRDETTSDFPGIASNGEPVSGKDWALARTRAGEPLREVKGVAYNNDPNYPSCFVVYVRCLDYGGICTIGCQFNNVMAGSPPQQVPAPRPKQIPKRSTTRFTAFPWRQTLETDEEDEDESTQYTAAVKGDRLPLFDEYRGMFINGVHRRLDQAADHFGGSNGGPDIKDAFFVNDAGIPHSTNRMRLFGLSWHSITEGEMNPRQTRRVVRGTTLREAGSVNFNSPVANDRTGYKAIRIVDDPALPMTGEAPESVADGRPARVNLTRIRTTGTAAGLTAAEINEVIGLVAGHEVGHKVQLGHPPNNIRRYSAVAITPDAAGRVDDTRYWILDPADYGTLAPGPRETALATWIPVSTRGAVFFDLEEPISFVGNSDHDSSGLAVANVQRPDGQHSAVILKFVVDRRIDPTAPGFDPATAPFVEMYSHAGYVSDHMFDFFNPPNTINVVEGERIDVKR